MGAALGITFGDVTNVHFRFACSSSEVHALAYVAIEHDDTRFLAQVTRVARESDMTYDSAARLLAGDDRDADAVADRLVAHASVVGARDERGRLFVPRSPLPAGASVEAADRELISDTLGLHRDGLYMGLLKGHDVKVTLDVNGVVEKHVSVLAKTGSGKSYAVGVLMEELLKRGVPVVVVDPHGEHASLTAPNANSEEMSQMRRFGVTPKSYAEAVVEYTVDARANPGAVPLKLDGRNLSARELSETMGESGSAAQLGILHQAVTELRPGGNYSLEDVIAAVKDQSGNTKWPVLAALEELHGLGLFSDAPTPLPTLVQPGRCTILNLKGTPPHIQTLVVGRLGDALFEARKMDGVPPFLFVVEEAHNFAPERTFGRAASSDVLRTIASEGRKFGMGLCIISQRPAKVDKNVLSQCNTQIILKVTNPNDLKAISSSVEALPSGIEDEIQALPIGVALVSDPRIAMPLFVEIRPRETKHGGRGVQIMRPDPESAPRRVTRLLAPPPVKDAGAPKEGPRPEDVVREFEEAEDLVARAELDRLDAGRLEAVLIEVERMQRALEALAARTPLDPARVAGLREALAAQRARLLRALRGGRVQTLKR